MAVPTKIQTGCADLELFSDVVVKRVDLELQRPPHDAKTELEILRKLSSEHVMRLISFEVSPGYVTFKFPRYTCDLNEFMIQHWKAKFNPYLLNACTKLYSNKITVKDSTAIIRQIVKGLAYIHSNGIIHRDIKPQNIMLNSCDEVVIGDFGISYNRDLDNSSKTCDCSTSIYKAPELLFSVSSYKFEIDIWALAVLISQLWNDKTQSKSQSSKVIDIDFAECSDIKLVLTIFSQFGKPNEKDWPQVANNESFNGMFGNVSSDDFLHRRPHDQQLAQVYKWMPLITDMPELAQMWLSMVKFDGNSRISAKSILSSI
ncbi:unnamed protein product [Kluyveromyces dobzhanskii CBS 2104]|uniref:WGS project CCBQ000000000 data, contig 00015 n=1 Tax=Kluyveromyces dobzhanskii CBS 2104 TaxID=1427455 RepID=A0A0A8LC73_9SACH|nr:unnamed protein product [Kluyveromyces dobzhanskii CBS 2104]